MVGAGDIDINMDLMEESQESIFSKYVNLREYKYIKQTTNVSKIINQNMCGKKIVFYGDGLHTKEVLNYISADVFVQCVISDISQELSYIREKFDIPVIKLSELNSIDYEYVVLLGYWSESRTNMFASDHGIKIECIYRPYIDTRLQRLASMKNKILHNRATKKPLLFLVLPSDRRDFITVASEYLKDSFELVKIYIYGDCIYERNIFFDSVHNVYGDLGVVIESVNKIKPDVVVFFHSGQLEIANGWYLMSQCLNKCKFIFSTTDLFYSDTFCLTPNEMAEKFSMNLKDFQILKKCESELLRKSDGVITNWGGKYMEQQLMPIAKSALFSNYFHKECSFKDVSFKKEELTVCYTGNLCFDDKNDFLKLTTLDGIFKEFLEREVGVFVYNFQLRNTIASPYMELMQFDTFHWKDFVPTEKMPDELSQYHFGINILNIGQTQLDIFDTTFNSLFQAKMSTYLAAGLPIIVSKEYKMLFEFICDYGLGFGVLAGDIGHELGRLTQKDFYSYKTKVYDFQQKYLLTQGGAFDIARYLRGVLS